jgi:hypothetical protein
MPYGVCKACSWIVEKQARSCSRCGQLLPFDYTKSIPAHVLDEARHCFKELGNISASVARIQNRYLSYARRCLNAKKAMLVE